MWQQEDFLVFYLCVCFLSLYFCYKYFSNILLLLLILCLVICIFGTYWLYASIYWRHAAIMDSAIRTARGWIVSILSSLSPSSNTNHKTFSCLLVFVFLCGLYLHFGTHWLYLCIVSILSSLSPSSKPDQRAFNCFLVIGDWRFLLYLCIVYIM